MKKKIIIIIIIIRYNNNDYDDPNFLTIQGSDVWFSEILKFIVCS